MTRKGTCSYAPLRSAARRSHAGRRFEDGDGIDEHTHQWRELPEFRIRTNEPPGDAFIIQDPRQRAHHIDNAFSRSHSWPLELKNRQENLRLQTEAHELASDDPSREHRERLAPMRPHQAHHFVGRR